MSVKQIDNVDVEVPLQPLGIHVGPVHHLHDIGVTNDGFEARDVLPDGKHIDNIVFESRGYLDEAGHAFIAFAAVLHIYC